MSLWSQLLKSYNVLKDNPLVNDLSDVGNFLMKDGLVAVNAQLEVTLDDNARLINARLVPKEEQVTIIPATPKSIGRTSGVAAHPLFDKLDYLANDWSDFESNNAKVEDHIKKHLMYLDNLKKWADYTTSNQLKLLYKFFEDNNNKFLHLLYEKIDELKELSLDDLSGYLVRFVVGSQLPNAMWENNQLYKEWVQHYRDILGENDERQDISYLNGQVEPLQTYFPQKIRHQGDKAKLISSNDHTIVTYGGRFDPHEDTQAVTLGQSSMQNAMSTLRWLIHDHAFLHDNLTILTWNSQVQKVFNVFDIEQKDFNADILKQSEIDTSSNGFDRLSNKAINAIMQYGQYTKDLNRLTNEDNVNVLMLDGDSQGRMSICYYNEFCSSQYYKNLQVWFEKTQWIYQKDGKTILKTPTFYEIFSISYYKTSHDSKVYNQFLKQILPCVMEARKLPQSLVKSAVCNVMLRSAFDSGGRWYNSLCTTCALINNYRNYGGKFMQLDTQNTDRSYLFGRLLAIAEQVEYVATRAERSNTSTNAERMFTQFTIRPGKTWFNLEKQLQPYYDKLYKQGGGGLVQYFKGIIQEIITKMSPEDFTSNKALSEMFLLGYYGQRNYRSNNEDQNEKIIENEGE